MTSNLTFPLLDDEGSQPSSSSVLSSSKNPNNSKSSSGRLRRRTATSSRTRSSPKNGEGSSTTSRRKRRQQPPSKTTRSSSNLSLSPASVHADSSSSSSSSSSSYAGFDDSVEVEPLDLENLTLSLSGTSSRMEGHGALFSLAKKHPPTHRTRIHQTEITATPTPTTPKRHYQAIDLLAAAHNSPCPSFSTNRQEPMSFDYSPCSAASPARKSRMENSNIELSLDFPLEDIVGNDREKATKRGFPLSNRELSFHDIEGDREDVQRALSSSDQDQVPHGLVPVNSDSDTSGCSEQQQDDEEEEFEYQYQDLLAILPPETPMTATTATTDYDQDQHPLNARLLLTPRVGALNPTNFVVTPSRSMRSTGTQDGGGDGDTTPLLNPFRVLNPGIPQNHQQNRNNSLSLTLPTTAATPSRSSQQRRHPLQLQHQQQLSNMSLVTASTQATITSKATAATAATTTTTTAAATTATNCIYECFAIEDVAHFLCPCPSTPQKATTTVVDTTTVTCQDFFHPNLITGSTSDGGEFLPSTIQEFINYTSNQYELSPKRYNRNDPVDRQPQNRAFAQKTHHVQQLLAIWHHANHTTDTAATYINTKPPYHDDAELDMNDMIAEYHYQQQQHVYQHTTLGVNHYNITSSIHGNHTHRIRGSSSSRRRKRRLRRSLYQQHYHSPQNCYDSDPEQLVQGQLQRRRELMMQTKKKSSRIGTTAAKLRGATPSSSTKKKNPTTEEERVALALEHEQQEKAALELAEYLIQLKQNRRMVEQSLQEQLEESEESESSGGASGCSRSHDPTDGKEPHYRKFSPSPFTHLDTDEETEIDDTDEDEDYKARTKPNDEQEMAREEATEFASSDKEGRNSQEEAVEQGSSSMNSTAGDDSTSSEYQTAEEEESEHQQQKQDRYSTPRGRDADKYSCDDEELPRPPPVAPRNSDPNISFDFPTFTKTFSIDNTTGAGAGGDSSGTDDLTEGANNVVRITPSSKFNSPRRRSHHRNASTTSVSSSKSHSSPRRKTHRHRGHRRNLSISSADQNMSSPTRMSFDFGNSLNMNGDTGGRGHHRRNPSATSLSTTGHSRFHTIQMSPAEIYEESTAYSSKSDSWNNSSLSSRGHRKPPCDTRTASATAGEAARSCKQISAITTSTISHTNDIATPSYMYDQQSALHWTEFQLMCASKEHPAEESVVKSRVHELLNMKYPLIWHPPPTASTVDTAADDVTSSSDTNTVSSSSKSAGTCPTVVIATSRKIASLFVGSNGVNAATAAKTKMSPKNKSKKNITCTPTPIAVHGAFEVGAHLEQMVVQPKFTWTPAVQPNLLRMNNNNVNRDADSCPRELLLSESAPPQVELLSIIRVNKPSNLDRSQYPFARLDRICCITTNDPNHPSIVLECPSSQERDWLVFSLKLIVARLASIIITRDEDMLHEFFSPYTALMQLEDIDFDQEEDHEEYHDEQYEETVEVTTGSENIVVVSSCDATCNSDTVTTNNEDLKTIKEKRSREDAFGSGSNNYVRADSILQSERSATVAAIIVADDNDRAVDESIIIVADDDDNNDYDHNEEEFEADVSMDGDDENKDVDNHDFPFAVVEQQPRQGRDDEDLDGPFPYRYHDQYDAAHQQPPHYGHDGGEYCSHHRYHAHAYQHPHHPHQAHRPHRHHHHSFHHHHHRHHNAHDGRSYPIRSVSEPEGIRRSSSYHGLNDFDRSNIAATNTYADGGNSSSNTTHTIQDQMLRTFSY